MKVTKNFPCAQEQRDLTFVRVFSYYESSCTSSCSCSIIHSNSVYKLCHACLLQSLPRATLHAYKVENVIAPKQLYERDECAKEEIHILNEMKTRETHCLFDSQLCLMIGLPNYILKLPLESKFTPYRKLPKYLKLTGKGSNCFRANPKTFLTKLKPIVVYTIPNID